VDQPVVAFFLQLHDVTAPPALHVADIETAPPGVPSAPLDGVRVTEQPEGGTDVPDPCQTTATDAEPVKPGAVVAAVYTQLRPPMGSVTFACPTLPPGVGVEQSRDPVQVTPVAAGEQATVSAAFAPPFGLTGLDCATQVMAACAQVIV
jgi:hypothetical protein